MRDIFRLKTIWQCFIIFLLFSIPISGMCGDADRKYAIRGAGSTSCGKFVYAMRNKGLEYLDYISYLAWVTGYITAVNRNISDTYDITGKTDIDGLMLWIENYCNKNPLVLLGKAVDDLVNELYPNRTTKAPK